MPVRLLSEKLERLFRISGEKEIIPLSRRVSGIALIFVLFSALIPLSDSAEGSYVADESYPEGELTTEAPTYTAMNGITDDGFLLKPALTSTTGDRSRFGDVFVYTVHDGDTLSSIASRFHLKKETVMGENDLYNQHNLRAGIRLNILPVDGVSHVIAKGETLDTIAKKYKVDKAAIVKQNQLEGDLLAVSATLIIPGAVKEIPRYIASRGYRGPVAPLSPAGLKYTGPTSGGMIWPTQGKLTQGFRRGHYALDIGNRSKGPIYAAGTGKVIKAATGWNGGYGTMAIIDHGGGMQTLYAHMEKLYVEVGQIVSQGDTIGWMGNTGRVHGPTGIHLHFEVRVNGVKYNPIQYF